MLNKYHFPSPYPKQTPTRNQFPATTPVLQIRRVFSVFLLPDIVCSGVTRRAKDYVTSNFQLPTSNYEL